MDFERFQEDDVAMLFLKLQQLDNSRRLLDKRKKEYKLSTEQFTILKLCTLGEGIRTTELSQLLGTSLPAVSRKVNVLTQHGYLEKIYGQSEDKRSVDIRVTQRGNEVVQAITTYVREWATLDEEQKRSLDNVIDLFVKFPDLFQMV